MRELKLHPMGGTGKAVAAHVIALQRCYEMGFDCGKNGATTVNCHFSLFAAPELTKAWAQGKAAAESDTQRK